MSEDGKVVRWLRNEVKKNIQYVVKKRRPRRWLTFEAARDDEFFIIGWRSSPFPRSCES
jgi:hypothetical protein